jgi:protein-L-isoaspartate O-methyltransferase
MAIDWNESYAAGRDYSRMRPDLFEKILKAADVNAGGTALDIGCGSGEQIVLLAHL